MSYILLITLALAAFAWLSIRHFHIALPLFLALLPTYLIRFSLGPLPTTFLEMCFWILFGTWVVKRTKNFPPLQLQNNAPRLRLVVIAFIILSCTSIVVVPHEHLISSLGLWRAYFFEPLLFGWMLWKILSTAKDPSSRLRIFLSLSFSAFIIAILGIAQYVTRLGIPAPWDVERRITSVFDYPNALGLFLAPILGALFVFGMSTWKNRLPHEKMFVAGSSVAMTITIVLAKTEAALVAIPAALLIAFIISPLPQKKQKIATVYLAMIVFIGACAFSPVKEKILLQDLSGQVRISQWKETLALLRNHPLTGAGIGYYPELLRNYHHDWQYEIFQYPHMIVLNVWVELGILGVVCWVLGMVYLGKMVWKRRHDPLVLAAGTALLTMCIHGLVDVPFFKNDLAMLTVFFVVIILTFDKTSSFRRKPESSASRTLDAGSACPTVALRRWVSGMTRTL